VRDGKRAVEQAKRACELSGWKEPFFQEALAAAYAECGDFEKALEWQNKAIKLTLDKADLEAARVRLTRGSCRCGPSNGRPGRSTARR
jgi:hypothetical protein